MAKSTKKRLKPGARIEYKILDYSDSKGRRKEVTSGGHMAVFEGLLYDLLVDSGLPETAIYTGKSAELPGYYRPSKEWELVVLQEGDPVAAIEFKSQRSSFGNNWNNRVEEVVGTATDFRTAMEKGVIDSPVRPWLGMCI